MAITVRFFSLLIFSVVVSVNAQNMDTLTNFDKLWDYRDPAATEKKFRELLPEAESKGDKAYLLELKTQIARTLGLQREFELAHELLDSVETELDSTYEIASIRYKLERGRVYNSSDEKERSRDYFKNALTLADRGENYFYAVDAAHMLAIAAPSEEEALEWNLKAIDLAEGSKDDRAIKWLGSLYNNIGWTYHDMKDYERSMDYFIQAKDWHEKHGSEVTKQIAWWSIAKGKRMLGEVDEAMEILGQLLEANKEDGYIYEELGECYLIKEDKDMYRKYFSKAYEILSADEWLKANEKDRLERMKKLSTK